MSKDNLHLDLNKITASMGQIPEKADKYTAEETLGWIACTNDLQNVDLRNIFAKVSGIVSIVWLGAVLVFVYFVGRSWLKLSDTILGLLIGTTTTNVLGVLIIIVKYLFNSDLQKKPQK
jgi:hypothetical protein